MLLSRDDYFLRCITKPNFFIVLLLLAGCDAGQAPTKGNVQDVVPSDPAAMTPLQRAEAGKALWEEKCRTVAGERIYKTVPDVEGLVLLKLRPEAGAREWADPMWPGAAFAVERRADEYISSFLGYEHSGSPVGKSVTETYRGYINTSYLPGNPSNLPGYRYVDVYDPQDGQWYRYTGSEKVVGRKDITAKGVQMALSRNPNYDLNVYRWTLDKARVAAPGLRYGVSFEDHVIPEERVLGVASSTVMVINLQTGEVLGEMLRYAWSTPSSRANPSPWLSAHVCPRNTRGASTQTRQFVDQIIIPRKEK